VIALSIRQPWAWLILHAGKDIENRSWPTKFRGRILVHASKGLTRAEYEAGEDPLWAAGGPAIALPPFEELERGGIVGAVDIVNCVTASRSPWFCGQFGFVLRDPRGKGSSASSIFPRARSDAMPIKPENRAKYPADWKTVVVPRIRARSGDKCERCGVANGAVGWREKQGGFVMLGRSPEEAGERCDAAADDGHKVIRIVLTVAHLHDPDPANCADDNLAHLCQRCHNLHDAPMRVKHARQTRRAGRAIGDLFITEEYAA
jgi:hypothetical protein